MVSSLTSDQRRKLVESAHLFERSVINSESFFMIWGWFAKPTDLIQSIETPRIFYAIAPYPPLLTAVLNLYQNVSERRAALLRVGYFIMVNAADSPESIKILLELFDERLSVVLQPLLNHCHLLGLAAEKNVESLKMICSLLSSEDINKAVRSKDHLGRNLLYHARNNIESIKIILPKITEFDGLTELDRLALITHKDNSGKSLMDYDSAVYNELIKVLLGSFASPRYRLSLVKYEAIERRLSYDKEAYDHVIAGLYADDVVKLYCNSMRVLRSFCSRSDYVRAKQNVFRMQLNECNNMLTMRKELLNFLNIVSNRLLPLQKELMETLMPGLPNETYRQKLKNLSEVWEIKPKSVSYYI